MLPRVVLPGRRMLRADLLSAELRTRLLSVALLRLAGLVEQLVLSL